MSALEFLPTNPIFEPGRIVGLTIYETTCFHFGGSDRGWKFCPQNESDDTGFLSYERAFIIGGHLLVLTVVIFMAVYFGILVRRWSLKRKQQQK